MKNELTPEEREKRLVELVQLDYDGTLRALNGFVTTASATRTVGLSVFGLVGGLSITQDSIPIAVAGLVLLLLLAFLDAYQSALYARALRRAVDIERLLDRYLQRLGVDRDDDDAVDDFLAALQVHRFGFQRTLRRVIWRELFGVRPRVIFVVMYPLLVLAAILNIAGLTLI